MRDVREFVYALAREFKIYLTGGVLIALEAFYQHYTGRSTVQPWGAALLAGTFVVACFKVWQKEHARSDVQLRVTKFFVHGNFSIDVKLVNPGDKPVTLVDKWRLTIERPNKPLVVLDGQSTTAIKTLPPSSETSGNLTFDSAGRAPKNPLRPTTKYVVSVEDLRGYSYSAPYQPPDDD